VTQDVDLDWRITAETNTYCEDRLVETRDTRDQWGQRETYNTDPPDPWPLTDMETREVKSEGKHSYPVAWPHNEARDWSRCQWHLSPILPPPHVP